MDYLAALNPEQRQAVTNHEGPMLVLAGAGSGKTRVLTHRIAHLIFHFKTDPTQILAVTFTNKAAAEMKSRVLRLLGLEEEASSRDIWLNTFHSACTRILRSDIHHLGYSNSFTIYDDSDQLSVIKACMKEHNISESAFSPKAISARINKIKNDGQDHTTYRSTYGGPLEDAFLKVFTRYADCLKLSSAVDFADLILLTVKLFTAHPQILRAYQGRFQHILIDEYQDTNRCQYQLVKLLAGPRGYICAVGDEDQSIYRWRGADISNILNFEQDYPNTKVFKLEQNYRSTKNIIEAATCVIANNTERREKNLWTENATGDKVPLLECYDEHDEALKVAVLLEKSATDIPLNHMAVFYRTNAQSRLLEDMLRSKGLNYEIYGGLKFYERLEIKDSLAYLKLLANKKDDVSFRRIVNVPTRGIGNVSLERLSEMARTKNMSLLETLEEVCSSGGGGVELGRSLKHFRQFQALIHTLLGAKPNLLPSDLLNLVLEETGYRQDLTQQMTVESQSRLENLAELRQSLIEYELRVGGTTPDKLITLEGFLEEIALISDIDRLDPNAPAVKLMTIHMAKGLEFERVHIVGLEEELFPNIRAWEAEENSDIEEERRLFYVGMTRAKKNLSLFYAKNRTVYGNPQFRVKSRFLDEIPTKYLELHQADFFSRRRHYLDRPGIPIPSISHRRGPNHDEFSQLNEALETGSYSETQEVDGLTMGCPVEHPTFGRGVIRKFLGKDKLMVEFEGGGLRKISLRFTQLKGL